MQGLAPIEYSSKDDNFFMTIKAWFITYIILKSGLQLYTNKKKKNKLQILSQRHGLKIVPFQSYEIK